MTHKQTQQERPSLLMTILNTLVKLALVILLVAFTLVVLNSSAFREWFTRAVGSPGEQVAWYTSRASGIVSYLLLSGSMAWGLVLSSKIIKEVTPAPVTLALHNAISWAGFGLVALHAVSLLFDTYYTYYIWDILVPGLGPYKPGWVAFGIFSLYLMFVISASFNWRGWLSQRGWQFIHYMSFPMYVMSTIHGFFAGTDSREFGILAMYAGSVVLVLFLVNYRLMAGAKVRRAAAPQRRQTAQPGAAK